MFVCLWFIASLVLCMSLRYDDLDYEPNYRSRLQFTKPFRNGFRSWLEREMRSVYPSSFERQGGKKVRTKLPDNPNPKTSVFPGIRTSQKGATHILDEKKYPFMASVVHSPNVYLPHICSAACIQIGVFITTARCIFLAKVAMTRVIYKGKALESKAFVTPPYPTKDMFNDLGIIVVNNTLEDKMWDTIPLYSFEKKKETDVTQFTDIGWLNGTAVGHIVDEHGNPENIAHPLYEMQVVISPFLCNYLYNKKPPSNDYFVPCYSSCDLAEHYQNNRKCFDHLAGEGHIVIEQETKHLLGIASWSGYYKTGINKPPLPVGMAVPDTFPFLENNLLCAERINSYKIVPYKYADLCY